MTVRSLSLVSLLVALAIGGFLYARSAQETGPTSDVAKRAESQASSEVAAANFQSAMPTMEAYRAEHATYAGALLPPVYGVVVVRADETSYCLQADTGDSAKHVIGPGGTPAPGPC